MSYCKSILAKIETREAIARKSVIKAGFASGLLSLRVEMPTVNAPRADLLKRACDDWWSLSHTEKQRVCMYRKRAEKAGKDLSEYPQRKRKIATK